MDLFYSNSVLQFMEPRDLTALIREARRFLKPSGGCFHVVDCHDFHASNDNRIPPLAYLAWPGPAWNLLTSRYLNYQNRMRMPQFVTLFEREGFSVHILGPVTDPEDMDNAERHLANADRFRDMAPEEVATRHFPLTGGTA